MTARILVYDVETFPNVGRFWGLWRQNIAPGQIITPGRVCGVGAKWHGSKNVMWFSEFHDAGGHEEMVRKTHNLFDQADIVVGYNQKKFDTPRMRTAFVQYGLQPPSPFKEVDLYQVVSRQLSLPSNKLGYVAEYFGLEQQKMKNEGDGLWRKCMEGDAKAWATMRSYCKRDVKVTEALYERVRPWIPSHPHLGLYVDTDDPMCGHCGGRHLQRRGYAVTQLGNYPRFQCQTEGCGKWSRGKKAERYIDVRGV